jgi:hypothetical protein
VSFNDVKMDISDKWVRIWNKAVMAYVKILPGQYLHIGHD